MSIALPCVLVVEDDPSIRELYGQLLRDEGYRVEMSVDGQDGLDHLSCEPDVILLDMLMPVMGGQEFLLQLRAGVKGQATPVLAMSATHGAPMPAGAQAFLGKPFEIEAFLLGIAALMPTTN